MSDQKRRLLTVTPGNIRNSHLYVRGHYDFFPADCLGPSRKRPDDGGRAIEIVLEGMNETIRTDIGANVKTGKPRGFFRGRTWVRRFFDHHNVRPGDLLALERIEERRYRRQSMADICLDGLPGCVRTPRGGSGRQSSHNSYRRDWSSGGCRA